MTEKTTKIREIFKSLQGEGPHVGELQVFLRFCGCNLNCNYCDTDFEVLKSKDYTPKELIEEIMNIEPPIPAVISLTGGEPLLSVEFLKQFLPPLRRKGFRIYLETNATLPDNLLSVLTYIDTVSADIKLPSATGMPIDKAVFRRFFAVASDKELFGKIVFDKNITDDEIDFAVQLAKDFDFEIILQPRMIDDKMSISIDFALSILDKFYSKYHKVRLIPQVHKFIEVR